MSTYQTLWSRSEFVDALTARFPEVAAEIMDISEGLLHMEMGDFARCTTEAIRSSDFSLVEEHFRFIEEAHTKATDELLNAIVVSYLENVFLGETAQNFLKARTLLSPRLLEELHGLEEHWKKMGESAHCSNPSIRSTKLR